MIRRSLGKRAPCAGGLAGEALYDRVVVTGSASRVCLRQLIAPTAHDRFGDIGMVRDADAGPSRCCG